jgi:hypothetical protein
MKNLIIILILFIASNIYSQQNNQFVFLFDNSGSMSSYYQHPNSSFKLFSKALIRNSIKPGDEVDIMLFSKTEKDRGMESPKVLYEGSAGNLVLERIMQEFKIIRARDGDMGRTDLIEVLDKGISVIEKDVGIIWLVTDNINDNSGSGDASYLNTLKFYERLRRDNNIRKILLYPVPEIIREDDEVTKGYVVYGIVYSKEPLSQIELSKYDSILRGVKIKQKAITLKPLDIGTIVLVPKKTQSKIYPGKLYFDGKTLRGYGFEEGEPVKEVFNDLSLKSNLYPYFIKSARLSVRLEEFESSDYSVKSLGTQSILPSTVSNVSPEGKVTGFSVIFNMPDITPTFSFNTIFKEDFTIGGDLVLEVSNVDIELDENYMNQFRELFALQSVPEIFRPVLKDKKIITKIPLEISMNYGPWRLFVLIGLIIIAAAIIFLILFFLFKKKCFTIVIDDSEQQTICLNSLSSYSISKGYSSELGKIKVTLFGSIKFLYSKFTTTPNNTVTLIEGIPIDIKYEEDNLRTENITLMIGATVKRKEEFSELETEYSKFH